MYAFSKTNHSSFRFQANKFLVPIEQHFTEKELNTIYQKKIPMKKRNRLPLVVYKDMIRRSFFSQKKIQKWIHDMSSKELTCLCCLELKKVPPTVDQTLKLMWKSFDVKKYIDSDDFTESVNLFFMELPSDTLWICNLKHTKNKITIYRTPSSIAFLENVKRNDKKLLIFPNDAIDIFSIFYYPVITIQYSVNPSFLNVPTSTRFPF